MPSVHPQPGPAHTAQRVLPEPWQHLHVPACSECSVNILLLLLPLCGLWPGLEQSGDAPRVQTAAWRHPMVRGEPGLRGDRDFGPSCSCQGPTVALAASCRALGQMIVPSYLLFAIQKLPPFMNSGRYTFLWALNSQIISCFTLV